MAVVHHQEVTRRYGIYDTTGGVHPRKLVANEMATKNRRPSSVENQIAKGVHY
jgi:hypothetical protein